MLSTTKSKYRVHGWAWIALTLCLALHVMDEASHDFLSLYNPIALRIRQAAPVLPIPVFTFLMGLLGFPLSRARPREGKYAKLFMSAVSYAVFYNLQLIAKTWVEQGVVKSIPGLWWPHLLMALLIIGLIWNWPGPAQQRATTTVSRG